MVVVHKLINTIHFILVRSTHKVANIVEMHMKKITKLHGVPKAIISYKDPKFTLNNRKGIRTIMNISTSHLESNGQTKTVNQVIEDMLMMYVMGKP